MSKLDDILIEAGSRHTGPVVIEDGAVAKQQIKDLMLELVGPDLKQHKDFDPVDIVAINFDRANLRKKVEKL